LYLPLDSAEAVALLKDIKALGIRAGIALKPKTPIEGIVESGAAAEADMVLVMTVEPGTFHPHDKTTQNVVYLGTIMPYNHKIQY